MIASTVTEVRHATLVWDSSTLKAGRAELPLAELAKEIKRLHRKIGLAAIWAQAIGVYGSSSGELRNQWSAVSEGERQLARLRIKHKTAGAIGRGGTMPWHLPEDLQWFKTITGQDPVIMGSRTWLSLPPRFRPLPGRRNIVVSRRAQEPRAHELTANAVGAPFAGAELAPSLAAARQLAGQDPAWIIGGGQLYAEALKDLELVVITQIAKEVPDADTFAPELRAEDGWRLVATSEEQTGRDGTRHFFTVWQRAGDSLRV